MRPFLHLGSGTHPSGREDWIDLDIRDMAEVDLCADGMHLPFRSASFDAVYCGHVLEHIEWGTPLQGFLAEVARVMAPGARLAVVGPCIRRALVREEPMHVLDAIIGEKEGPEGHRWVPTEALTLKAVRQVFPGAVSVPVETVDRPTWPNPSTAGWQAAILAEV